jgi:Bacterial regulatory proteins, luxR family
MFSRDVQLGMVLPRPFPVALFDSAHSPRVSDYRRQIVEFGKDCGYSARQGILFDVHDVICCQHEDPQLGPEGKTNKEIAAELGITMRTAETHRAKIMSKLGLHSLAALVHYTIRHKIISAPNTSD